MNSLIGKFVFAACLAGCAGAASAEATLAPVVPQASRSGPSEVLLWDQMDAQQRARLWPLLTHEQRLFQWRYMTKDERREMRMNMTPGERRAIKQRYVIDFTPNQERTVKSVRRMTPAERELLRQQVIEVHVEIRRGVPYNCNDPTDCRRARKQSGLDVHQLRQTVPAETKVAKPAATLTVPANPPAPAGASESASVLTTP